MPPLACWFSGTALFLAGSFSFTIAVGLIGIKEMISDRFFIIFLFAAVNLSLLAWYTAAKQASDSADLTASIQKIAGTANINPNQSAQALADEIIKRLEPLKEGLDSTKKEVDRLVNPPRVPDGIYQNNRLVGTAINPVIDSNNKTVSFQVLSGATNMDIASRFEFRDLILMLEQKGVVSEQGAMGVVTRRDYGQVLCRIVGNRK
jgi:hypothetical protein